jgi:hypothetical protein
MRPRFRVCVLLGALTALCSCGSYNLSNYRAAITDNQRATQQLQLGMSGSQVRATLGEGEVVSYKKLQLVDPWRSESFVLTDGKHVAILYYITEQPRSYGRPNDESLTPIVLENDRVVGWGWSYLRRQSDRYGVSTPHEQR